MKSEAGGWEKYEFRGCWRVLYLANLCVNLVWLLFSFWDYFLSIKSEGIYLSLRGGGVCIVLLSSNSTLLLSMFCFGFPRKPETVDLIVCEPTNQPSRVLGVRCDTHLPPLLS